MFEQINIKGYKHTIKGTELLIEVPKKSIGDFIKTNRIITGELRLDDGRKITSDQRKKAYATIRDIADFLGYMPEELKELMKYHHIATTGCDYFSLSNCSVSEAREFINTLIDFCIENEVPLTESALERTDDIARYIYSCMLNKKCVLCGEQKADIHHFDAIGMGRDRTDYDDSEHEIITLCRKHHNEAHNLGVKTFCDKHKVFGIQKKHFKGKL